MGASHGLQIGDAGGMNMRRWSVFPISHLSRLSKIWICETCILVNLLIDRDADGWSVVRIFRPPPCPICFWSCLARARHQFTCVQLSFQRVWSAPNLDSHLISHFLFLHNWNRFQISVANMGTQKSICACDPQNIACLKRLKSGRQFLFPRRPENFTFFVCF